MKSIQIGNRILEIPLIQGGMGVGISRCHLAGAVAGEGGMGVISTAQIGYDRPDFAKKPEENNLQELPCQIRKAKEISRGRGMVAVNIMAVTQLYGEYVRRACEAGVDAIVTGAGLPTILPKYVQGYDTKIAPVISSARALWVILRCWDKKFARTADFIVIEGPYAGGHLGFSFETLGQLDTYDFDAEIKKILTVKHTYEEKYNTQIPAFVAGGIWDEKDAQHALSLGADGIQVGTRFVTTRECDASDAYKQAYIRAKKEDIVIIHSPVGMPGRAIRNEFIDRMECGRNKVTGCYNCLKACDPKTASYCISQALINAVKGELYDGLIFCGGRVGESDRITTVKEVIHSLGFH